MKNLLLFLTVLFLAGPILGQVGIEFTAGYTPGFSLMLNDNDLGAGDELTYKATYGSQAGVTAGFNFSERVGLLTGIGLTSINQNFDYEETSIFAPSQGSISRRLTYIRIPLMIRVGGDPTAPTSAFFRFGPHLDMLSGAIGRREYTTLTGSDRVDTDNYREYRTLLSTEDEEIYSNSVIGLTMEVGGRFRISDVIGVLLLFHLESSLTNPEGEDAWKVFRGDNSNNPRASSWNVMPGINVSFQYVLSFQ